MGFEERREIEAELGEVGSAWRSSRDETERLRLGRDQVIAKASAAGVTHERILELTGLRSLASVTEILDSSPG